MPPQNLEIQLGSAAVNPFELGLTGLRRHADDDDELSTVSWFRMMQNKAVPKLPDSVVTEAILLVRRLHRNKKHNIKFMRHACLFIACRLHGCEHPEMFTRPPHANKFRKATRVSFAIMELAHEFADELGLDITDKTKNRQLFKTLSELGLADKYHEILDTIARFKSIDNGAYSPRCLQASIVYSLSNLTQDEISAAFQVSTFSLRQVHGRVKMAFGTSLLAKER